MIHYPTQKRDKAPAGAAPPSGNAVLRMTTNLIKNLQFQIGEWVFSPAERTLFHLEQETNVDLDQRTAQLLHLFIQRANEVLSREEIIEAIWDRSVVTDHAGTQSIF